VKKPTLVREPVPPYLLKSIYPAFGNNLVMIATNVINAGIYARISTIETTFSLS